MSGLLTTHSGINIHCQTSFPPQSYTKSLHHTTDHPIKVFSSLNSKVIRIISAKREGIFSKKKSCKMREENPTLPKSCKQGVQIKRPNSDLCGVSMDGKRWAHMRKEIWLSSSPSQIAVRFGNIGNQGMQHSSYL